MKITKNLILTGKHEKPIVTDIFYKSDNIKKPVLVFSHGYKGFKDWGAWDLMANAFATVNIFFVKFNFSHNGGTPEQPVDFPDLEAFGNNNYTKELDDLATIIDWISTNTQFSSEIDLNNISLMGHSRGGGIVILKGQEDSRIKNVISLAGVSDYGKRFTAMGDLDTWKTNGVTYVINGRTKQKMPHYYQFYEDFIENQERLNIERATR
ncbi:alpha/beta hydrolase family protein [Formosa sp. S-31]|uniref:alpha/beta hydrolase family protein n=1 Tax=Formosa sp. S-31 TaxID=2790949 RepID=UPI003EBDBFBD